MSENLTHFELGKQKIINICHILIFSFFVDKFSRSECGRWEGESGEVMVSGGPNEFHVINLPSTINHHYLPQP